MTAESRPDCILLPLLLFFINMERVENEAIKQKQKIDTKEQDETHLGEYFTTNR